MSLQRVVTKRRAARTLGIEQQDVQRRRAWGNGITKVTHNHNRVSVLRWSPNKKKWLVDS